MPRLIADTDTETDKIFQEENVTTTRTSTTMENETSFRNVTLASAGEPSRNPNAYGVIAAAGKIGFPMLGAWGYWREYTADSPLISL